MTAASSRRRVRIADIERLADAVRGLTLVAADGGELPDWEAGAHIDVVLPSGTVRQYSLCGSPRERTTYRIAVLREDDGRGGSAEVHQALRAGDELDIAGPRNHFALEPASSYLFVAGGIGITPILPMIEQARRQGVPWTLAYGGRSRSTMAFLDRLEPLDEATVVPQDEHGLLDLRRVLVPRPGALVYCCGPAGLLAAAEEHCGRHWPPRTLRIERFTADPVPAPAAGGADDGGGGGETGFEVQLGEGGPVVDVPPDQSILQTLLDAGADVLYSCEEGTCGSCETTVLGGDVDHRDQLLTEASREMGTMLICVSRARCPRLVLDVEPPPTLLADRRPPP